MSVLVTWSLLWALAQGPPEEAPPEALALIRRFEGLRLRAYPDPVGLATIGYGHTGAEVRPSMRITRDEAEALLRRDAEQALAVVRASVHIPLTRGQTAALVSLVFNIGEGRFLRSGLLRALNRGDIRLARMRLLQTCYAGRPPARLPGLVARRQAEAALFSEGGP